ncbi:hypothetical protein RF11_14929 [Thelohanellus kitauei]|uniref:Uncharacterized protein n=1 Tax=Thelohanellus kitauei TaxID=669202 RepID=A0A0C2NEL3_THEKT|nr:hypothetical protein RF11_14929 [Thelohanellus kitauei]
MISFILFFVCIPLFMGYNASKYDIEACYKIIQSGPVVLVGVRFPTFNSLYPTVIYMIIKRKYSSGSLGNFLVDTFHVELMFHSLKCNKTMEISHFGDGFSSEFTIYLGVDPSSQYFTKYNFRININTENQLHVIDDHFRLAHLFVNFRSGSSEVKTKISQTACFFTYLSRVYLIRYEALKILNTALSTTVDVKFVVISQNNRDYGDELLSLSLKGWRLNCPSTIPPSMMIEDVVYDPSWNEIQIKISIQDLDENIKETSILRIKNGLTTYNPENEVVFPGLTFKKIRPTDYLWYTNEIKAHEINILPLVQLRITKYECEIDGQEMILTEYSFQSNIIERCMMAMKNYGNYSIIQIWENIEHSYASLCMRRHDNKYSQFWHERDVVYDPSWKEIKIEISIQDLGEITTETSGIRSENGIKTIKPESEIVFTNMNFKKFGRIHYIFNTHELKVDAVNILALLEFRMTKYECEINDSEMILREYSFKSNVIERCMMGKTFISYNTLIYRRTVYYMG